MGLYGTFIELVQSSHLKWLIVLEVVTGSHLTLNVSAMMAACMAPESTNFDFLIVSMTSFDSFLGSMYLMPAASQIVSHSQFSAARWWGMKIIPSLSSSGSGRNSGIDARSIAVSVHPFSSLSPRERAVRGPLTARKFQ